MTTKKAEGEGEVSRNVWGEERVVDLLIWLNDGFLTDVRGEHGERAKVPTVEIGRADSRQRLGFLVKTKTGEEVTRFALDRAQVIGLCDYLAYSIKRLKRAKNEDKRAAAGVPSYRAASADSVHKSARKGKGT